MKILPLFFMALIYSTAFSQGWSVNPAGGSIRARDSMRVDSLRNSVAIGTDANGKFVRSDSVRACSVADYARVTGIVAHGITPGTHPVSETDSTFTDSYISEIGDTVKVFGEFGHADTAFDNFNRSLLGASWTTMNGLSAIDIQGDTAAHKSANLWCGAYYNEVDSASAQTVSAKMIYNTYTYIAIRSQRNSVSCYALGWGGAANSIGIYRFVNGIPTIITGPPYQVVGDGHVFTLSGRNDTLIMSIDGTPLDTAFDSTIPGGWPAIIGYRAQAPTYGLWDDWSYSGGVNGIFNVDGISNLLGAVNMYSVNSSESDSRSWKRFGH